MQAPPPDVTDLLLRWSAGDTTALESLTPVIYDDLRRLARALLSREQPGHPRGRGGPGSCVRHGDVSSAARRQSAR